VDRLSDHPDEATPLMGGIARTVRGTSDGLIDRALRLLPIALAGDDERGVLPALIFWQASTREHHPEVLEYDTEQELIQHLDVMPEARIERALVEEAMVNAYKAVEALLGSKAPKGPTRFRKALVDAGIAVDRRIGLLDETPTVGDRLRALQEIRDQRAA